MSVLVLVLVLVFPAVRTWCVQAGQTTITFHVPAPLACAHFDEIPSIITGKVTVAQLELYMQGQSREESPQPDASPERAARPQRECALRRLLSMQDDEDIGTQLLTCSSTDSDGAEAGFAAHVDVQHGEDAADAPMGGDLGHVSQW